MQMTKNEHAGHFILSLDSEIHHKWQFAQAFLDELKELIPANQRTYDKDSKVWTIGIGHYKAVYDLYQKHFVPKEQLRLEI